MSEKDWKIQLKKQLKVLKKVIHGARRAGKSKTEDPALLKWNAARTGMKE
jgi:hypothetical protein